MFPRTDCHNKVDDEAEVDIEAEVDNDSVIPAAAFGRVYRDKLNLSCKVPSLSQRTPADNISPPEALY